MFNHLSLGVPNYHQSCKFYQETLSVLYPNLKSYEGVYPPVVQDHIVFFKGMRFTNFLESNSNTVLAIVDLSYGIADPLQPHDYGSPKGVHFCFVSPSNSKELVDAWYSKALSLGAIDNGAPGPRQFYGDQYYGAFVIDPSGYRIEVCVNDYLARYNNLNSQ